MLKIISNELKEYVNHIIIAKYSIEVSYQLYMAMGFQVLEHYQLKIPLSI